jgi:hypothetical protein
VRSRPIDKTAQGLNSPELHRVTQPVGVAPLTADVDQLGITKREELLKLVRVGVAPEAAIAPGLLIGQELDRHPDGGGPGPPDSPERLP